MTPIRHFGSPSRALNSNKPYSKPASPSVIHKQIDSSNKENLKTNKPVLAFILNDECDVGHIGGDIRLGRDATYTTSTANATTFVPNNHDAIEVSGLVSASSPNLSPSALTPKTDPETSLDTVHDAHEHDIPGMPTRAHWAHVVSSYLSALHSRKRDKALISSDLHRQIFDTLAHPDATHLGTPQFRFWARKMFRLVEAGGAMVVTHGGRPVAVKERIYDILCMAHAEASHAGRDKTCKVLRDYYTWIPKELTAKFVKACPTCTSKRAGEAYALAVMGGDGRIGLLNGEPRAFVMQRHLTLPLTESRQLHSLTGPLSTRGPNDLAFRLGDLSSVSTKENQQPGLQTRLLCTPSSGHNIKPIQTSLRRASFPPADKVGLVSFTDSRAQVSYQPVSRDSLQPVGSANLDSASHNLQVYSPGDMTAFVSEHFVHSGIQLQDGSKMLPPLMQFLTKEFHAQAEKGNTVQELQLNEALPIDPVLLTQASRSVASPCPSSAVSIHPGSILQCDTVSISHRSSPAIDAANMLRHELSVVPPVFNFQRPAGMTSSLPSLADAVAATVDASSNPATPATPKSVDWVWVAPEEQTDMLSAVSDNVSNRARLSPACTETEFLGSTSVEPNDSCGYAPVAPQISEHTS